MQELVQKILWASVIDLFYFNSAKKALAWKRSNRRLTFAAETSNPYMDCYWIFA